MMVFIGCLNTLVKIHGPEKEDTPGNQFFHSQMKMLDIIQLQMQLVVAKTLSIKC